MRHEESTAQTLALGGEDNLQMWSHNGNGHKGVCLKFDASKTFFTSALQVRYDSTYPRILFSPEDQDASVRKILLSKSKDWAYEKEWRPVYPGQAAGRIA